MEKSNLMMVAVQYILKERNKSLKTMGLNFRENDDNKINSALP